MPNIPAVIRPQDQYANSIGSMLQGSGGNFVGPVPSQTTQPTPQASAAPKKITYGNTAATSPKQQYINDLSASYGLNNGTVYDKSTTTGFSNSDEFFKSAGVNSFDNLKFDTAYTPTAPNNSGYSASLPQSPQAPAPTVPVTDPYQGYKNAYSKYIESLTPDTGVSGAKQKYLNFVTNEKLGENALEGQGRGIPLQLVRGNQAKLRIQSELEAQRLQGDIGIAQDTQTTTQNQGKARVDYEKSLLDQSKPTEVGGSLVRLDPTTGKYETIYSAPQKPIELGAGSTLIDPTTGKPIYSNPATPSYQANPLTGELFDSKTGLGSPTNASNTVSGAGSFSGPTGAGTAASVNNVAGIKGSDGKFVQYATPQESFNAVVKDIQGKQTGNTRTGLNGNSTLDQFVKTWITGDSNSTRKTGYSSSDVAKYLGLSPTTKIGQIDATQLASAVAHFETGYNVAGNSASLGNDTIGTLAQGVLKDPQTFSNLTSAQQAAVNARFAQAHISLPSNTKPPTDTQYQSSIYATRVQQSGGVIDSLESKIAAMNPVNFEYNSHVPSYLQSADYQSYDQAARNLINAVLRRESGAAISSGEFDNAYKQYLPRAGDTQQTLTQKKQNRDAILNGLVQSSGNAYTGTSNNSNNAGSAPDYGSIYGF